MWYFIAFDIVFDIHWCHKIIISMGLSNNLENSNIFQMLWHLWFWWLFSPLQFRDVQKVYTLKQLFEHTFQTHFFWLRHQLYWFSFCLIMNISMNESLEAFCESFLFTVTQYFCVHFIKLKCECLWTGPVDLKHQQFEIWYTASFYASYGSFVQTK